MSDNRSTLLKRTGRPPKRTELTPEWRAERDKENLRKKNRRQLKKLLDKKPRKSTSSSSDHIVGALSSSIEQGSVANHSSNLASIEIGVSRETKRETQQETQKSKKVSRKVSRLVSLEYPPEVLYILRSPSFWRLHALRRGSVTPWSALRSDSSYSLKDICDYVLVDSAAGFQMLIDLYPALLDLEHHEVTLALSQPRSEFPVLFPEPETQVLGPVLRTGPQPTPSGDSSNPEPDPTGKLTPTAQHPPEISVETSQTTAEKANSGGHGDRNGTSVNPADWGSTTGNGKLERETRETPSEKYVSRETHEKLQKEFDKLHKSYALDRMLYSSFIGLVLREWPRVAGTDEGVHLRMQEFRNRYVEEMNPNWPGWRFTPVTEKMDFALVPRDIKPAAPGTTVPVDGVPNDPSFTDVANMPDGFDHTDRTTWPAEWNLGWYGGIWKGNRRILPSQLALVPKNIKLAAFILEMYLETRDPEYLTRWYDNDEENVVDELARHAMHRVDGDEEHGFALFVEWCRAYAKDKRNPPNPRDVCKTPYDMLSRPGPYFHLRCLNKNDRAKWSTPADVLTRINRQRSSFVWGVSLV